MNGRVTEINDNSYTIEVRPISASCGGCGGDSGGCSCQSKTVSFTAVDPADLNPAVGDVVKLDLNRKKALFDGLLFFLFPLTLLSLAYYASIYLLGLSAGSASLAGLAGLASGFALIYCLKPGKQSAVIESVVFKGIQGEGYKQD